MLDQLGRKLFWLAHAPFQAVMDSTVWWMTDTHPTAEVRGASVRLVVRPVSTDLDPLGVAEAALHLIAETTPWRFQALKTHIPRIIIWSARTRYCARKRLLYLRVEIPQPSTRLMAAGLLYQLTNARVRNSVSVGTYRESTM